MRQIHLHGHNPTATRDPFKRSGPVLKRAHFTHILLAESAAQVVIFWNRSCLKRGKFPIHLFKQQGRCSSGTTAAKKKKKKNVHPALRLHNDTVSRATNTRAVRLSAHPSLTSSSCTLPCPRHHLLAPPPLPPPTLLSVLFHLPPKPPVVISDSPLPEYPTSSLTLADTPRTPRPCLSPPFPQLVCLCAATQPISAHPAGAGSLTQPLWRT